MTTEHVHEWREIGKCSHVYGYGKGMTAFECACGRVGHKATSFLCGVRISAAKRAEAVAREQAACPIWERLKAQKPVVRA